MLLLVPLHCVVGFELLKVAYVKLNPGHMLQHKQKVIDALRYFRGLYIALILARPRVPE